MPKIFNILKKKIMCNIIYNVVFLERAFFEMRNTDRFKTIYRKATPFFPLLAVFIAASSILAFTDGYDPSLGYFRRGTWFAVFAALVIVSGVFSAFLAVISKKTELGFRDDTTPFSLFTRLLAAASALVIFVKYLISVINHEHITVANAISCCLMLFTALAFILSVFPSMKKDNLTTIAWLLASLSVNLDIFVRYFDFSTAVNSDLRILFTVAECAVLLFMISEIRISFEKKYELATSPFYVLSNCFASSSAFGIAIGLIYYGCTGEAVHGTVSLPWAIFFVAAALTAADRMLNAYRTDKK